MLSVQNGVMIGAVVNGVGTAVGVAVVGQLVVVLQQHFAHIVVAEHACGSLVGKNDAPVGVHPKNAFGRGVHQRPQLGLFHGQRRRLYRVLRWWPFRRAA